MRGLQFLGLALIMALSSLATAATLQVTVLHQGSDSVLIGARVVLRENQVIKDSAVTDVKGQVTFGVVTGIYQLNATLSGYREGQEFAFVNNSQSNVKVTIPIAQTPPPPKPGSLQGKVTAAKTGTPLIGATLVLSRRGTTTRDTVQTNNLGHFIFDIKIPANGYSLTVTSPQYVSTTRTNLTVIAGDTTTVDFILVEEPLANASIVGNIADTSKKSLAGATVVLSARSGGGFNFNPLDTVLTDANGHYEFNLLKPSSQQGTYSVAVALEGYLTANSRNINLTEKQNDTVNFTLSQQPLSSMAVFVGIDSAGHAALKGASVFMVLEGPNSKTFQGIVDDNGWFILGDLPTGNYSVTASAEGYVSKTASEKVELNLKDTALIFLVRATAQNSKSLSGIIRDVGGKGLAGAQVIFRGGNSSNLFETEGFSSVTGDYILTGLPPNLVNGTLIISKNGYVTLEVNVTLATALNYYNGILKERPVALELPSKILNRSNPTKVSRHFFVMGFNSNRKIDILGKAQRFD